MNFRSEHIGACNVVYLFLKAAEQYPERVAIVAGRREITYGELRSEVLQTAAYLRHKGIQSGDRVLVFVPMSINLYRMVLAIFYVGATAVFLDEWVSRKRLVLCCRMAECKGFIGICKARVYAWFTPVLRRIPVHLSLRGRRRAAIAPAEVKGSASALITFTTGSTGTPKAADRSHAFLRAQFGALLDEIQPTPTDVDMVGLPIVLFVNLGVGCTSVIPRFQMRRPERNRLSRVVRQLEQHRVTRMTASPFFVRAVAEELIQQGAGLSHLQNIFTGGAPVFPDEAEVYERAFPKATCRIVYGSTEAEPISSILTKDLLAQRDALTRGLPVGIPYHGTAVRVLSITEPPPHRCTVAQLEAATLPPGELGEIAVAGAHVLDRYYRNDEAFYTNKIIADGQLWHRTGDSGFLHNGQLYLTGRVAQLIQGDDGAWLSPFVVEYRLQQLPSVRMGTLVEVAGQRVLVVEWEKHHPEANEIALSAFEYDELKSIPKMPRDPRHHSKIDYGRLREIIAT